MRKIDESERPMPEIDLAKVCFIIEKSREYRGRRGRLGGGRLEPRGRRRAGDADRDGRSLDPPRTDRIHQGSGRRRSCGGRRARLDRAGRLPAGGMENRRRRRRRSGPRDRPGNTSSRWSSCRTTSRTRSPPSAVPARASDPRTKAEAPRPRRRRPTKNVPKKRNPCYIYSCSIFVEKSGPIRAGGKEEGELRGRVATHGVKGRRNFLFQSARNPLKSPDSEK